MPPKSSEAAATGLRLNLPGAPNNWHLVPAIGSWWFHPVHPTPVGAPGEPTIEQAREWSNDPSLHVETVSVKDMAAARADYQAYVREARGLVREVAAQSTGDIFDAAPEQAAALEA